MNAQMATGRGGGGPSPVNLPAALSRNSRLASHAVRKNAAEVHCLWNCSCALADVGRPARGCRAARSACLVWQPEARGVYATCMCHSCTVQRGVLVSILEQVTSCKPPQAAATGQGGALPMSCAAILDCYSQKAVCLADVQPCGCMMMHDAEAAQGQNQAVAAVRHPAHLVLYSTARGTSGGCPAMHARKQAQARRWVGLRPAGGVSERMIGPDAVHMQQHGETTAVPGWGVAGYSVGRPYYHALDGDRPASRELWCAKTCNGISGTRRCAWSHGPSWGCQEGRRVEVGSACVKVDACACACVAAVHPARLCCGLAETGVDSRGCDGGPHGQLKRSRPFCQAAVVPGLHAQPAQRCRPPVGLPVPRCLRCASMQAHLGVGQASLLQPLADRPRAFIRRQQPLAGGSQLPGHLCEPDRVHAAFGSVVAEARRWDLGATARYQRS